MCRGDCRLYLVIHIPRFANIAVICSMVQQCSTPRVYFCCISAKQKNNIIFLLNFFFVNIFFP